MAPDPEFSLDFLLFLEGAAFETLIHSFTLYCIQAGETCHLLLWSSFAKARNLLPSVTSQYRQMLISPTLLGPVKSASPAPIFHLPISWTYLCIRTRRRLHVADAISPGRWRYRPRRSFGLPESARQSPHPPLGSMLLSASVNPNNKLHVSTILTFSFQHWKLVPC